MISRGIVADDRPLILHESAPWPLPKTCIVQHFINGSKIVMPVCLRFEIASLVVRVKIPGHVKNDNSKEVRVTYDCI